MNEIDIIFESESDAPEGWQSNVIFERDGRGNLIERFIPDDMEVTGDVVYD